MHNGFFVLSVAVSSIFFFITRYKELLWFFLYIQIVVKYKV